MCGGVGNIDKGIKRRTHRKTPRKDYKFDSSGIELHLHNRGVEIKLS